MTGNALNAVQMITSGVTAYRSMRATVWLPLILPYLARAYADLGQFEDASHCIGEAMTVVETTKERWWGAEVYRTTGDIALLSPVQRKDLTHRGQIRPLPKPPGRPTVA